MKNLPTFEDFLNEAKVITIKISDLDFNKHAIKGEIKIQSPFTSDASQILDKKSDVEEWIEAITQKFGKQGTIEIDQSLGNKKVKLWQDYHIYLTFHLRRVKSSLIIF
jgi:hypothetical protein